jgi:tetratricopeptide (TPR) repeat protein
MTVQRWEQNRTTPQPYHLERLCKLFGQTAAALGLAEERPVVVSDTTEREDTLRNEQILSLIGSDLTLRLVAVAFGPFRGYQVLQNAMIRIIEEDRAMNEHSITRREALRRVVMLPLLTLKLDVSALPAQLQRPPEEVIAQCAAGITACWELSKGSDENDLHLAFKGVSAYLPTLKTIVRDFAPYRKQAASLAGQCASLKCLLGWHLQGLKEAIAYGEEGIAYGEEAEDIPLVLGTLTRLAWAHYYNKQSKQALRVISQAIPHLKEQKVPLPSHVVSNVYGTIAVMQAINGQQGTEALRRATDHFFAQGATEDRFVYGVMECSHADLILKNGIAHYQQGLYEQAQDSLKQLIDPETLSTKFPLPERSRIEGINIMTLASLKAREKDMEQSISLWKAGISGAIKLRSEQRFDEALLAYEIIEGVWPGERRIKELRELTSHW